VLLAIPSIAIYNTFIYLGTRTTTAANAGLIVGTMPIVIFILASLAGEEQLTTRRAAGIAVSFAGVVFRYCQGYSVGPLRAVVLVRRSFHHRVGYLLGRLLYPVAALCHSPGHFRSARGVVGNRARIMHPVLRLGVFARRTHRMVGQNVGSHPLRRHLSLGGCNRGRAARSTLGAVARGKVSG
jgi:hypothetical protein